MKSARLRDPDRVSDTTFAAGEADALRRDGCWPQQYFGWTDLEDYFRTLKRVERLRAADTSDVGGPFLCALNRLRKRVRRIRIEVCRVGAGIERRQHVAAEHSRPQQQPLPIGEEVCSGSHMRSERTDFPAANRATIQSRQAPAESACRRCQRRRPLSRILTRARTDRSSPVAPASLREVGSGDNRKGTATSCEVAVADLFRTFARFNCDLLVGLMERSWNCHPAPIGSLVVPLPTALSGVFTCSDYRER